MTSAPIASGVRIGWSDLPPAVRAGVEGALGAPVVQARTQRGGFSPGTADRVVLADGRRAFVKSVGESINATSAELHRTEARMMAALPEHAPAPDLLHVLDADGWVTLVLEDIEGRQPALPWSATDVERVAAALSQLRAASPMAPEAVDRTFVQTHAAIFGAWRFLAGEPPAELDPWCAQRLSDLAQREQVAAGQAVGDSLLHCDVRSDNLLIRPDGRVVLVDWAWACRGPSWLDPLELLLSVIVQGGEGSDPAGDLLAGPLLADAPRENLESVLLSLLGMFEQRSREPAPPGLPTLRAWQRHCADTLRCWLAEHVQTLR